MNAKYRPHFVEVAQKLSNVHATAKESIQAGDIIQEIKEKELVSDSRAKKWEQDRKKEWKENKPYYMKSLEKGDPAAYAIAEIKHGGKFKSIKPTTNYLLIRTDKHETTASGIILTKTEDVPNTGIVIEAADTGFLPDGSLIKIPFKKADHILFRKYAGMEVEVNGEKLLMLTLLDIIATIS